MDEEQLKKTVAEAAHDARRTLRQIEVRTQSADHPIPVSYTHLDVYKRQPLNSLTISKPSPKTLGANSLAKMNISSPSACLAST